MIKDIAFIAMGCGLGGCLTCLAMILVRRFHIIKLKREDILNHDDQQIGKLGSKIKTSMAIGLFWIVITGAAIIVQMVNP
ncbi:MAG: hypothetical protein HGA25_04720 [Clostridiales bacterium]|nr:hypothetical protein [Clostridiales bacterium]